MTINLATAIAALENLTLQALRDADAETLRKFANLAQHWHQLADDEAKQRASTPAGVSPVVSPPLSKS